MSDKIIIWIICAVCFVVLVICWAGVEMAQAKYRKVQSISEEPISVEEWKKALGNQPIRAWPEGEYDGPVYDLYEYTQWLSEKGALVTGFGEEHLVEDYCK